MAGLLDELGVVRPHVGGNSLGGWVALELAAQRPLASVTLISPAGLWTGRTPRYTRLSLRAIYGLTSRLERPLDDPHALPRGAVGGAGPGLLPAGPDDP